MDTRIRLETAVSRCFQKCSVPSLAEPRPRTLPRGVRKLISQHSSERQADEPGRQRQRDGADDRQPREQVDLPDLEPAARVPDEMAQAAQHVVEDGPRVAEQNELAEWVAEQVVDKSELALAHG